MNPERHQRISELFLQASELGQTERDAFLDEACADDSELRSEVESLLAQHLDEDEAETAAIAAPVLTGLPRVLDDKKISMPDRIGPYRIVRLLGEGGMGEVYEAEQEEPVRRRVALKIIKLGMDTRRVIARFESERQALALMNHSNVAKVFDAGATEDGRPYFVMELVQGESITQHCDRTGLTVRERLELFMQVCEGVQHAHQKGIIHRDIKPSNILVQVEGQNRIPKIIDFGVAKATAQRLTEKTLFTESGVLIGTPEYMSPEQAEMSSEDVDTRTDVYSLGVVLYELLVGALPFDPKGLREAGYNEMCRMIREEEPSKPSARLVTLGDASTESAKKRRTDPRSLARQMIGDLDWITMKALEKDRTRRYSSAHEFAADIERYRSDQPVLASPPSVAYRSRKFVRRHTGGVAAAAAGLLVLVAFAVTMTVQAGRIADERDRTRQEAQTATQALDFMTSLFQVSDPSEARGNSITAREILDKGAKKIEETLRDQPLVQGRMMSTMGNVYMRLGLYAQAEPLLVQALAERRRVLGGDHQHTLNSMYNLAVLHKNQGRYAEAESLQLQTLESQRRVLGDNHPDTLISMYNLANLYTTQGRYDEAEVLCLETLETRRRASGDDDPETLKVMNNLAVLYRNQVRYDEAESLYLKTLETQKRAIGHDHPDTLSSMGNLASLYTTQGRYDEAEPLYLETLETQKRVFGDDHPDTLSSRYNLAGLYHDQGRYAEAEPLYLETLETQERVLGDDHSDSLMSMNSLATLYHDQGRYAEAEPLYLEIFETQKRVLGDDHPNTLTYVNNLANLYYEQGRYAEAEPLYLETLETQKRVLGDDHPDTLRSMNNLAGLYVAQGRYDEAEPLYLETLETQKRVLGDDHFSTMISVHNLARVYRDTGRLDEAGRGFERVQRFCDEELAPAHGFNLANLEEHAKLLRRTGDDAGADRLEARTKAIRGE